MPNHEYSPPPDDTEQVIEREELVDQYLVSRDMSYSELVNQLEERGGKMVFNDNEQLTELCATLTAGTMVEFSEQLTPDSCQHGTIVEDVFAVPHADIGQRMLYRPYICAVIDSGGIVDALLFPVARRSSGQLEVRGLRILPSSDQA